MTDLCRACGSTNIEIFLDLGDMPLAGGFLAGESAIADERTYALPVHVCNDCALVQFVKPVDPEILFQDYLFSSSTVPLLVTHFKDYAAWLQQRYAPKQVVEFGCNDGVLLQPLSELGVGSAGVDISENICAIAREKGLDVTSGYFGPDLARALRDRLGPIDIVTGSNAFAHNSNHASLLEGTEILLAPDGHLCLEIMYAGDLYEQVQWDTLYHEHLTFYSLGTISTLLARFGFHVYHAERLPMHGGSLRVSASRDASAAKSPAFNDIVAYEAETKLNDPVTWHDFASLVQCKIDIVKQTLTDLSKNARFCGYGAAGRATLWVNACGLNFLEAVVDASPLRAGKLMPGTHTPIVFPDALWKYPPDYIFITAWNYADVIRNNEPWFEGTWITPLPEMSFLTGPASAS